MTDPSGSMTFTYDVRGRLTEKTSLINGHSYSVSKSFTLGGRISSETYPTGRTMDYDRSGCACRVDMVSTTYNGDTTILVDNLSYRPFGIANGMHAGSGGTVVNQFDQSGRLTVANPGQPKEQTYTYDADGNLTSIQAPAMPWHNRTFTYDALNRLTEAEGPYGTIDYAYDDVGNRLTKVVNGQTETYGYITGTNLLQEVTGTETTSYSYDANGNITGIGNKTLSYNQNNRLIRVEEDGDVLGEYTYNGLGRRVIKEAAGVTTVFHYDFNGNIVGESDSSGTFTAEYLYRGKGRVAKVDVGTGAMSYYLNDRLGTPLLMTDETNTVIWEGVYKPFGEADVNPNSSVVNNHRFPGQYYDEETGLHYNGFRLYDPKTGRYITPDPIGLHGGVNLFLYAECNPINGIDPLGLWYIDFNFNIGSLGGITFGIIVNDKGVHPYAGGGLMSSPGVAVTWSPCEPVEGKIVALQVGSWVGGQYGDLSSESDIESWEVGFVTPGVSLTAFHVFGNVYNPSQNDFYNPPSHIVRKPMPLIPGEQMGSVQFIV